MRVVHGQQWRQSTAHHEVSSNGSNSELPSGGQYLEYQRRHQLFWVFCDFTQSQCTDAWIEPQIRPRPLPYTYFSNIYSLLTLAFDAILSGILVGPFNKSQIYSKGLIRRTKIPQNRQWWNPYDKEAMQDLLKDRLRMPCYDKTKKPVTSCTKNIKNGVCYVIILSKFLTELS